ncbi:MAG: DUF368 domain-containing protein [Pseudomonadales bacterium]|nr:DUF368 domain-containing protein [Pseudomonadales bacterium]
MLLFLKGMAMGAADTVPGISGGTIAFIANIYEELINAIKSLNLEAAGILFKQGFAAFWRHINGEFLLTLLLGILSSLLLLANLVVFLLDEHAQLLMAFFIGLILASCWYVAGRIEAWNPKMIMLLLLGLALSITLALLPARTGNISLGFFFVYGAVAICAMILPGISGAFILVLLGAYAPVLNALKNLDMQIIGIFAVGCITGLIVFSNLLSFLFKHYRNQILAFLLGILAGSLYSLWPWKQAVAFGLNDSGQAVPILYRNLSPLEYSAVSGEDVYWGACLLLLLLGFFLVYGLEKFALRGKTGTVSQGSP